MRKGKKIIITVFSLLVGFPLIFIVIIFAITLALYFTADFKQPSQEIDLSKYQVLSKTDSLKICNNSVAKLNKYGLWEVKISGNSIERGATYGLLCDNLLKYQEDVFVNQIHNLISSERAVEFLHKLIILFNRNMALYIPQEYREEIYAMSLSCTDRYNSYGSPYVRQLNYHAAHDIGHAMQDYMLVGCTSFACWGEESETKGLILGRNFDFYVGDDFAKNKVVLFVEPTEGYRFVSISWPGMMGVVSGMNEKGLTVTINAAKGEIPISSAMPISILIRHILQYATNIEEAYDIAQEYKTFVSESIMVGSVNDGKAVIIEKTPQKIALYSTPDTKILCTNHYQSDLFSSDEYNIENIETSDSPYRYARLNELLSEYNPIDVLDAVKILRDRKGQGGKDIGLSNEKSINQFIAHHSVVFQPNKLRLWVSTSPWQLGEYICYDLNEVFNDSSLNIKTYMKEELNIAADSILINDEYIRVSQFREQQKELNQAIENNKKLSAEYIKSFVKNNPNYFKTYEVLGDYMEAIGEQNNALDYWIQALELEIPRKAEQNRIIEKIHRYDKGYKSSL